MLKSTLEGKTVAIIGYQTLTSRILLKKLVTVERARIIAVEIGK